MIDMYKKRIKRIMDLLFGSMIIIMFLPLFCIISTLIKLDSSGPILYLQERLGLNGSVFILYKFRSINNKSNTINTQIYIDNPEITRVGKILRRFKLDELPQIINILKGEMSFVGPRPCLPNLINKFDENAKFRLLVKPGITGLAQINGNIYITWPERWKYDRKYVEELSFLLDLKIIMRTIIIIIFGERKPLLRNDK